MAKGWQAASIFCQGSVKDESPLGNSTSPQHSRATPQAQRDAPACNPPIMPSLLLSRASSNQRTGQTEEVVKKRRQTDIIGPGGIQSPAGVERTLPAPVPAETAAVNSSTPRVDMMSENTEGDLREAADNQQLSPSDESRGERVRRGGEVGAQERLHSAGVRLAWGWAHWWRLTPA
ncbi:unnamed protein product [Pleuronectes platessa]|uniref:Uncharacterized protein n=1 Tax=Pleuronectes platessa TaxID=8262 RepID=A0A9N7Z195_PLEPL|nr:unnamed protein product [Pleuronectes platessa]